MRDNDYRPLGLAKDFRFSILVFSIRADDLREEYLNKKQNKKTLLAHWLCLVVTKCSLENADKE